MSAGQCYGTNGGHDLLRAFLNLGETAEEEQTQTGCGQKADPAANPSLRPASCGTKRDEEGQASKRDMGDLVFQPENGRGERDEKGQPQTVDQAKPGQTNSHSILLSHIDPALELRK